MVPAPQALKTGVAVELQVQERADDLKQVNETSAQGVGQVKEVEQALSRSRDALQESEAALALSRQAEREASRRAMHKTTCMRVRERGDARVRNRRRVGEAVCH